MPAVSVQARRKHGGGTIIQGLPAVRDASNLGGYGHSEGVITNGTYAALFGFDIPATPDGYTILSAKLTLTISYIDYAGISDCIFNVPGGAWTEDSSGVSAPVSGPRPLDESNWANEGKASFDLTNFVRNWAAGAVNNGIGILTWGNRSGASATVFYTREAEDPSVRPVLTVTYGPQVVLTASRDAYVWNAQPDTNQGANTALYSDNYWNAYGLRRIFLGFDLPPAPAGLTLKSAALSMSAFGGGANNSAIARAAGPWTESGLTWNNQPEYGNYAGVMWNGGSGYRATDVLSHVQAWYAGEANNGFVLDVENAGGSGTGTFGSREGGTPPQLTLAFG